MVDAPVAAPPVAPPTVSSLADAQGYVTVYDHGPQPPADDASQPAKDAALAEKKAWDALNPDGVVAIRMATTDAAHAIGADPERYALEPTVDEAAITVKMADIRKRREALVRAKEDAADRQQAIGEVMSDRANERAAKAVVEPVKPVMRPPAATPVDPPTAPAAPLFPSTAPKT